MSGAQTEIGDESNNMDDDAFDAKTLYKNFMDLVQSQRLNIVQQSQAKRDGMTSNLKSDDFWTGKNPIIIWMPDKCFGLQV